MRRRAIALISALVAAAVLAACASKPPTRSELPRHRLTEAELAGKILYQSKAPAWELALSPGGRAVLKRFSTGEEVADATWSIEDGDLIVQWKKRTRLRLFGPGDRTDYEYINAMYPGRVYHLQIR